MSPRFIQRFISIWIVLSATGIILGFVLWGRLNASLDATIEDAHFRQQLVIVFSILQDAETAQRGYILTGDDSYLGPFRKAEAELPSQFDALTKLSNYDDYMRRNVPELGWLADLKIADMRRTIAARHSGSLSSAIKLLQRDDSREEMNKIRTLVADMTDRSREPFFVQEDATRLAIRRVLFTTLGSSLLGFGAGLLALYLAQITLKQEKEARILAEQALSSARMAKEKNTFLANVSHEIRTPMNTILGFSDLLSDELPANARTRTYAQAIRESASALLQLLNDILDLSRIEAGMLDLRPEPTAVREIADFLQTIFAQQALRKGVKFESRLEPWLPQVLIIDHSRLRQILVNLVSNAIKFTEKGSVEAKMGWELDGDNRARGTLRIEVRDTGIGIPVDRQEEIFEPFVSVNTKDLAEKQGAGLGLSTIKRLVQRMGGTITVESQVGLGSVFKIEIPDVTISARLPTTVQSWDNDEVDFDRISPSTILVVDDNSANRELISGYFEGKHHVLQFARNGLEAVESVKKKAPDLILMDIRMPLMDGRTALGEIRRLPGTETLPIIAVTASSMSDEERDLRQRFAGFIRKPFTRRTLFNELSAFLTCHAKATPVGAAQDNLENPSLLSADLAKALREIQAVKWVAVKESGAINETKAFANMMIELGRHASCRRLMSYGEALAHDADSYAVSRIADRINDFPDLVESLSQKTTSTNAT